MIKHSNKVSTQYLVSSRKNANQVTDWFINIDNKHQCTFIQLDIKDFYPCITEEILEKSLEFAKQFVHCTKNEVFH